MPIVIADLLRPIRADAPCGDEMSFSAAFDAIKEARRFDDPSLDQGAWETSIKEADWGFVVQQCVALLSADTKDLQLCVWLAEALAKTEGFSGLASGYRLLAGISQTYWDEVHPQIEGDDSEQRIGRFSWLLSRSVQLLRDVPVTRSGQLACTTADFEVARALVQSLERNPSEAASLAEGKVTMAQFEQSRRNTPYGFYSGLMADLADCALALKELEVVVDEKFGRDGPSFRPAKNALETVTALAARFAKDAGVLDSGQIAQQSPASGNEHSIDSSEAGNPAPMALNSSIQSRAQAVTQLRLVAEYFRKAEPHSPVAYLAEKAAYWSNMPLHVWLRTVLKEPNALAHLEEMLGVAKDTEGEQGQ